MIKVAVCGACGKMGQEVIKTVVNEADMELVSAIDIANIGKNIGEIVLNRQLNVQIEENLETALNNKKIDVLVDFTSPDSVYKNALVALNAGVRPVIGTTGLSNQQLNEIQSISDKTNIGALIAPNFTIGAVLMMMFAQKAAKYFSNAEIIELHHNQKKDAPSGTAIKTAELMEKERNIYGKDNIAETEIIESSRGGVTKSGIRIHSVRLPGYVATQEVIFGSSGQTLKIRHDSIDRSCYMPGVVLGIKYVIGNNEFIYGLENIL